MSFTNHSIKYKVYTITTAATHKVRKQNKLNPNCERNKEHNNTVVVSVIVKTENQRQIPVPIPPFSQKEAKTTVPLSHDF